VIKNDDSFNHTGVYLTDTLPQGVSFVPGSVQVGVSDFVPALSGKDTVSSGSYQVPAGVSSITVEAWGGGGRGGSRTSGNSNTGFGGGGGGAYARSTLSVTPLSTYNV